MSEFDYAEDYDRYADSYGEPEPPQPAFDERILDDNDVPITVGATVKVGEGPEGVGTVVSISDWDGDADDDGRTIAIPPRVEVRFHTDGALDEYGCYSRSSYGPTGCDEVEVVTQREEQK